MLLAHFLYNTINFEDNSIYLVCCNNNDTKISEPLSHFLLHLFCH